MTAKAKKPTQAEIQAERAEHLEFLEQVAAINNARKWVEENPEYIEPKFYELGWQIVKDYGFFEGWSAESIESEITFTIRRVFAEIDIKIIRKHIKELNLQDVDSETEIDADKARKTINLLTMYLEAVQKGVNVGLSLEEIAVASNLPVDTIRKLVQK